MKLSSSVLFALALLAFAPGVAAAKPPPWAQGGDRQGGGDRDDRPRGDRRDGGDRNDGGPRGRGRDRGGDYQGGQGPRRGPRGGGGDNWRDDRGGPPPVEMRRRVPQDEARDAVRQGRRVPMQDVVQRIQQSRGGRVLNAYPENGPDGRPMYRVRWSTPDGRRIDYLVDAETGEIVGREN